jgi:hypothetical protein
MAFYGVFPRPNRGFELPKHIAERSVNHRSASKVATESALKGWLPA